MRGLTPYLLRQRRYPVVKRSQYSFTALPNVTAERSEVRQPPPRLADLLPLIRPHEDVPDTVRRLLITLERAGADAIRRLRR